jgi:hypothetical protein
MFMLNKGQSEESVDDLPSGSMLGLYKIVDGECCAADLQQSNLSFGKR